jgi:hypothetical protein
MLTKRAYVKPHIDMTGSDLKIDGLENTIRFWRDPSRQIVFTLLDTITMTAEKLDALDEQGKKDIDTNFWEAVSEVSHSIIRTFHGVFYLMRCLVTCRGY